MKKIFLTLVVPFIAFALSAAGEGTMPQQEAEAIVLERLSQETREYTLYVTKELQKEMRITSSAGELLELNYWCWVFYIQYTDTNQGRYLIVKEANGRVLEVDAKSGAKPEDLVEWQKICPINIPFTEYLLGDEYSEEPPLCRWKRIALDFYGGIVVIINSNEELENYICKWEQDNSGRCALCVDYPAIDFSKYTLLLAHGMEGNLVSPNYKNLQQCSEQNYIMKVNLHGSMASAIGYWQVPIIISKIADDSIIDLIVTMNP